VCRLGSDARIFVALHQDPDPTGDVRKWAQVHATNASMLIFGNNLDFFAKSEA
jgi:hypothetical protein